MCNYEIAMPSPFFYPVHAGSSGQPLCASGPAEVDTSVCEAEADPSVSIYILY